MVREGPPQDREKAVWRSQVRFWSVAVISIALLSACFIVSCVVTYHLTYGKTGQRLSELHTRHSGLTCFSEGTSMRENVWACCPCAWKSFGSSCYFISTQQNFWSKSEQNCVAMGAHLVVINTEAEQILKGVSTFNHTINKHFDLFGEMAIIWKNFLVQQLNESLSYFLGLSDTQGNDHWQWIDQTPYKANVRLWHQNEPNFSAEECASIVFWENRGWGWNDVFCDTKRNSICEMKKIYL